MTNYTVFVILFICSLADRSLQQDPCQSCAQTNCPNFVASDCKFGEGKDVCGCCSVCLNGPEQECGGPFNILGYCGEGLQCYNGEEILDLKAIKGFSPTEGKCRGKVSSAVLQETGSNIPKEIGQNIPQKIRQNIPIVFPDH